LICARSATHRRYRPNPGGLAFGEGIVIGHPDIGDSEYPEIFFQVPNDRIDVQNGANFL